MKNTYSNKLSDPKWQKKRLQILDRDNWECQWCGDDKSELHVHHLVYRKGNEPWEYDDRELLTLCEKCHRIEAPKRQAAILLVSSILLRQPKLSGKALEQFAEALDSLSMFYELRADDLSSLLDVNNYDDTIKYVACRNDKEWEEIQKSLEQKDSSIERR